MKKMKNFIRNTLLAGVLTILPIVITYFTFVWFFTNFTNFLLPYINVGEGFFNIKIAYTVERIISFALLCFLLFFVGLLAKNYFGKRFLRFFEFILQKIPIVSIVYTSVQQIIDAFKTSNGSNFKKVLLVEYPRKGVYSIGFVTKNTPAYFNNLIGKTAYNVFIPTTPNPTSGYILIIPEDEAVVLDLTVEEGIRFVISGGLLIPEKIMENN